MSSKRPKKRKRPARRRARVANRLWIHRKKMGYTQREVARLLGCRTATHISDYERGRRLPSLETAIKLEVVLCAPVAFLFPAFRRRAISAVRERRKRLESNENS